MSYENFIQTIIVYRVSVNLVLYIICQFKLMFYQTKIQGITINKPLMQPISTNSNYNLALTTTQAKKTSKLLNSQIIISQPVHLSPLAPLTFSQQAALQFIQQKHGQRHQFNQKIHENNSNKQRAINLSLQDQLHQKNEHVLALQKELSLLKQLYNQEKNKYLDLKNVYKEGQYLFSVLEDKKQCLQKQNKELRSMMEQMELKFHKIQQKLNQQQRKNKKNSNIQNKKQSNILINQNQERSQQHSQNYSCHSYSSHTLSSQGDQNISIGNNRSQTSQSNKNHMQAGFNPPLPTIPLNSAKIRIGRKQKQIPVIKVSVPQQTFSFNQGRQNFKFFNERQFQSQSQHFQKIKNLDFKIKALQEKNILLQKQVIFYKKDKENLLLRLIQYQKLKQSVNIKVKNTEGSLETGSSQYNNYLSEQPSIVLQPHQSLIQSLVSNSYQYNQKTDTNVLFNSKYEYAQQELMKKDQMLKNLYNQCYKLQKQLDDLKLLDGLKTPKSSQKQYEHQSINSTKRIKQLQGKIVSLTSYSKKLLSDCDEVIKQLRCENSVLLQKNMSNEETIKRQQDQLKRLYKVLQNKNIELGQIYSNLKLAQSRRIASSHKKQFQQLQSSHGSTNKNQ